ncbi:hypothetical protein ACFXJ8_09720 [Nonomuraea sp. NPDC059194]|uniref:hypothetical protein n=1 Tax=Nonomuraea sp. NPDC059194 TaxID=3346764 RepID=UPI0036B04D08
MGARAFVPPHSPAISWVRQVPAPPPYRTRIGTGQRTGAVVGDRGPRLDAPLIGGPHTDGPRAGGVDDGQARVAVQTPRSAPRLPAATPPTARPADGPASIRPDPCATFDGLRRDYCYQVLDDLTH